MSTASIPPDPHSASCPICAATLAVDAVRCENCNWHVVSQDGIAGSPVKGRDIAIIMAAFAAVYAVAFTIVAVTQ